MKRSIILSFVLALVLLQGCIIKSLHPFFKKEDVVFKKELLNKWIDQEGNKWEILAVDESNVAYELRHTGENGVREIFIAHLFKLKDQLYIDFFPIGKSADEIIMLDMHLTPTHSIARVESLSDREVRIRWLNEEWLDELFTQNKIKISHEVVKDAMLNDKNYVLTASTDELQKFIEKYGDEDKAFIDSNTLWLKLTR